MTTLIQLSLNHREAFIFRTNVPGDINNFSNRQEQFKMHSITSQNAIKSHRFKVLRCLYLGIPL